MSDRHGDFGVGKIHQVANWVYADAAARTGATGLVAADIGKWARQTDDSTYWELTNHVGPVWAQRTGTSFVGGVSSVNGNTGAVVLDADDIDDAATTNKFATAAELTKLAGIEALADVTDAINVESAGAVMVADTTTAGMGFVVDEDDMVSDSATKLPSQQSVKAYVDASVAGGGYTDEMAQDAVGAMIADTASINLTYTDATPELTAAAIFGTSAGTVAEGNHAHTTTVVGPHASFDGGGSAITTAIAKPITYVPIAATITGWKIDSDVDTTAVVDIQRATAAAPTTFASIAGTNKPSLTADESADDSTLTGWGDTTLDAGDRIRFVLDSNDLAEWLGVALIVTRAV